MRYDIHNYTEEQLQMALDTGNVETAIELWKTKDWPVYSRARDALVALLRSERAVLVQLPQLQFIYFVNTHLRHRFSHHVADWKMFTSDLPPGHTVDDAAWRTATAGSFFSEVL